MCSELNIGTGDGVKLFHKSFGLDFGLLQNLELIDCDHA